MNIDSCTGPLVVRLRCDLFSYITIRAANLTSTATKEDMDECKETSLKERNEALMELYFPLPILNTVGWKLTPFSRYGRLSVRRVDLVGDYAGQELFLLEGDSLLLRCFSDPDLDFHRKLR